jgi:glutaredoxin
VLLLLAIAVHGQKKDADKSKAAPPVTPPAKIDYTQIGAPMPEMSLFTEDTITTTETVTKSWLGIIKYKKKNTVKTNILTNKYFESDANLLVMEFNPNCSHCVEETEMLKSNISLFKKSKLVMIANARMKEYLTEFVKQREIRKYPQITIGYDNGDFINNTFLYRNLPQINIYGPDHKMIKVYNGDVSIDSLKNFIQ